MVGMGAGLRCEGGSVALAPQERNHPAGTLQGELDRWPMFLFCSRNGRREMAMLQTAVRAGLWKGRGATRNPEGRFERLRREAVDDGWGSLAEILPSPRTEVRPDASRSVIARNESPDIPFDQSINPYRGCEHG